MSTALGLKINKDTKMLLDSIDGSFQLPFAISSAGSCYYYEGSKVMQIQYFGV